MTKRTLQALRSHARTLARRFADRPAEVERSLTNILTDLLRVEADENAKNALAAHTADLPRPDRGHHGSGVRIPWMSRREDAIPLQRCLAYAADGMGVYPDAATRLITYFLEAVAQEIETGNIVRIPGLGAFGPWLWECKRTGRRVVKPRFVASRGLRQQVAEGCQQSWARNRELANYQRSHHPSAHPEKAGSRTWQTMLAWREIDAASIPDARMLRLSRFEEV